MKKSSKELKSLLDIVNSGGHVRYEFLGNGIRTEMYLYSIHCEYREKNNEEHLKLICTSVGDTSSWIKGIVVLYDVIGIETARQNKEGTYFRITCQTENGTVEHYIHAEKNRQGRADEQSKKEK